MSSHFWANEAPPGPETLPIWESIEQGLADIVGFMEQNSGVLLMVGVAAFFIIILLARRD